MSISHRRNGIRHTIVLGYGPTGPPSFGRSRQGCAMRAILARSGAGLVFAAGTYGTGGQSYSSESPEAGEKIIRDMHKPPEGNGKRGSGVATGMVGACKAEEEENSDMEMDIERQEGKREVGKLVHGIMNGEIVGPAKERRMRHATKEGNKPSFWTYLMVKSYRGCRRQEEEKAIHHVLGGEDTKRYQKTGTVGTG
eukprot:6188209-Pleurochrysis_carterae.AAC.1